jgi:S-DNA-T family DNA segregation ATPase FtsK/SpoIIIE
MKLKRVNNSLRIQAEPDYVDEILNFADEKETNDNQNQGDKDTLVRVCFRNN